MFDEAGGPTATAQSAMAFCQAYFADSKNTVAFGQAQIAAKVLTPYHVDFRLPDGSRHQTKPNVTCDGAPLMWLPLSSTEPMQEVVVAHLGEATLSQPARGFLEFAVGLR
ncbi:SapC family protein [Mesorhizobium sp. B2-3-2]|uniref:SapC family protein n=1 Tax=unclassified Mesorhizobium TaxID=325217 RepID=UPI00112AEC25|nr:hypothetical protein FJ964_01050 [Mesorhizobium sp. B2-3-2]